MNKKIVAKELVRIAKNLLAEGVSVEDVKKMTINQIGYVILKEWRPMNYGAKPYADAMQSINSQGMFFSDDWTSIVAYFLSNANTWRGDTAKAVKAELNRRLKKKLMNG